MDGLFAGGQLPDLDTRRSRHDARPTSSGVSKANIAIDPAVTSDHACGGSPGASSTGLMRWLDRVSR